MKTFIALLNCNQSGNDNKFFQFPSFGNFNRHKLRFVIYHWNDNEIEIFLS